MKRSKKKVAAPGEHSQPVTRVIGPGVPVTIATGNNSKQHWSACPGCGQSKLSTMGNTPVCMVTRGRVEGHIEKYMRCRDCGKRYTAFQPD